MTSRAHLPAVFAILALLGAPSATAQEPEDPIEAEQWKNGVLPTGTYAGPNLSVNLYNGNVIASIPLVSLPGRAGHDLNLTLTYNSRQLVRYHDGTLWRARWFNDGPTAGRWTINAWPSLKVDVPYRKYYFTTPDGAVHKLDKQGSWGRYAEDGTNTSVPSVRSMGDPSRGSGLQLRRWDTTWMLALVCGGSAAVCFGIAALLLNHRTRARHAGWLLGLAYLLCWFATATWGAGDLEPADAASFAEQFGLPTSNDLVRLERLPDLSIRPETPHLPESISSGRTGAFLAAARLPLTPFLVRLDYAYLLGPLQGEAGCKFHVWLFGYRSRVAAKVFWVT